MNDETVNSENNEVVQLMMQRDMFRQQFIQSINKYETKIRELSIIKELSLALRSEVFLDRDTLLSNQLAIVRRAMDLQSISLMLVSDNMDMFEIIETADDSEGGRHGAWRQVQNDAAVRVVRTKKHELVDGMEADDTQLYLPTMNRNDVVGILCLQGRALAGATNETISFGNLLADQFATAIILATMYNRMISEEKRRLQISRFFSTSVAQKIFSSRGDVRLEGRRLKVSVIFADLCGFTSMSESMDQQKVVDVLNSFFSLMTPIIFKYDGTLDKLLGDGMLAFFGAPISHPDDELRAVQASMDMLRAAKNFREQEKDRFPIHMAIGINQGEAVAGYIGTNEHLNYTVIGDVVNTAQRLESVAVDDTILIGESIYNIILPNLAQIEGLQGIEELPPQKMKGKEKPVKVYQLTIS